MSESLTSEMLTIEEIEARYVPDWVLIEDPQVDEMQGLLGGRVLCTSSTGSDELYRKAAELGLDRIAVRYLGAWPDDMVLVL